MGMLGNAPLLSRVYVLTNGRPEWLAELKEALQADARASGLEEWIHIGTSRDLRLTKEQQHNAQAMDMAVAQRAEVFLGNGVRVFVFFLCRFGGLLMGILVFEYDVECDYVACGPGPRMG